MNLSVHYNMSTAQVMWGAARGASSYSVQAVTDQGLAVPCNTTNTSCYLNGLQCSHIYNVTVMARNPACDSMISETHLLTTGLSSDREECVHYYTTCRYLYLSFPNPSMCMFSLHSEPCPPTNVQASIACEQLNATVSWQQSDLAVGYVAYFDNQNGHNTSCVGSDAHTQCVVSGLMCGTVYNIWVKALGLQYNSSDSTVTTLTSAIMDCEAQTAAISWQPSAGAVFYVSELSATSGRTTSCTTNDTNCELSSLWCGEEYNCSHIYNVTVMARNPACDSMISETHLLTTEPCPPTNVQASIACDDLAVGYVAYFDNQNGHNTSCVGSDAHTQCVVSGLMCGTVYNVWVKALGLQYNTPCLPREVEVEVDCNSDRAAVVSWNATSGAANLSLTAIVNGSLQTLCATQQNRCNVTSLSCGETYNLSFTAINKQCNLTAPMHTNLTTRECSQQILASASGVVNYFVTASGSLGYLEVHNTTQTLLTATLPCGQDYNVTVQGQGSDSPPPSFTPAPCVPRDVRTSVQCEFSVGSVSWGPSDGAETYIVVATGLDGHTQQCLSNTTSCTWTDLRCGDEYTVVLRAKEGNCTSLPSNSSVIHMGMLCPTYRGNIDGDCLSGIVMVTWQASNGSDYYTATMQADTGISNMCMSDSNECSVPSLTCGHNFSVSVTASSKQCHIISRQTASLQSGEAFKTTGGYYALCYQALTGILYFYLLLFTHTVFRIQRM
uniref:Fibronectin type-III domain-containing protein n=1 Tax=Cyclopterus lumpus TaxID=8103 RepID=A0A8C2Z104_CYCLU